MSGDEEAEEQDLLSEIRDLEASNEAMYVREAGSRARIQELERERDGLVEALGRVRDRQWGRVVLPGDATIEAVPLDEVRAVVDELGVVLPAGLEEIQRVDFPTGSQGIQVVEERDIQPFTDGEGGGVMDDVEQDLRDARDQTATFGERFVVALVRNCPECGAEVTAVAARGRSVRRVDHARSLHARWG